MQCVSSSLPSYRHLKTSDYKNMLQYLMECCFLFDCMVIYLFQEYYLILSCKKVPWSRKKIISSYNSKNRERFIPYEATYFTEVSARVSLKVAPRVTFGDKTPENSAFLRHFSITEEKLQYFCQTWNCFCLFWIQIFCKWFYKFHWT